MAAGCTGIIWPGDSDPGVVASVQPSNTSKGTGTSLRGRGKCTFVARPYLAPTERATKLWQNPPRDREWLRSIKAGDVRFRSGLGLAAAEGSPNGFCK